MEQKIIIPLDSEDISGLITLEAESKFGEQNFYVVNDNVKLVNVPQLNIERENLLPIEFCPLNKNEFAQVMLLEETKYKLKFESEFEFDEENIFYTLKTIHSSNFPFEVFENNKEYHIYSGVLNFKDYVGKTFIDIKQNGNLIFSLPIEVRSKKIDYFKQYPKMISDLSQYSLGLIYKSNSPIYQFFNLEQKNMNIDYEIFMLLEYFFSQENLPDTFEYIIHNMYAKLERYSKSVPASFASNLDSHNLIDIISNSNNLTHQKENTIINIPNLKGFVPEKINEIKYRENIDTPENRFLKLFLETLEEIINDLLKRVDDGYVKSKLLDYSNEITYYTSNRLLKDISQIDYLPLNSQVLQKKEGYREILEYFLMLEFSFKMNWDEITSEFKGFEKRLSNLYEVWCYFKLIDILEDITGNKIVYENIFDVDNENLSIKLKENKNSVINFNKKFNDKITNIELRYNNLFSHAYNESYSVNLHPDYSLKIINDNNSFYIHFDAKYKFDKKQILDENLKDKSYEKKFKDSDIYKMHTYKDAIINSKGSYILYPGDKCKIFPEKGKICIPSVGAFPLNPGNSNNKEPLKNFLKKVLEI